NHAHKEKRDRREGHDEQQRLHVPAYQQAKTRYGQPSYSHSPQKEPRLRPQRPWRPFLGAVQPPCAAETVLELMTRNRQRREKRDQQYPALPAHHTRPFTPPP